jgi:hypothetical protein
VPSMRRFWSGLGSILVVAGLLLAVPGSAAAFTRHIADLTGDQEVPGPGDPDGAGFADLQILPAEGLVCGILSVEGIAEPTAAHIHAGGEGVAGDVVVTLLTPTGGTSDGCVENLDEATLQAIIDDPGSYYVNVHNEEYQAGAVRGELVAAGDVTVKKFICPETVQTPEDIVDTGFDMNCQTAVTEAVADPAHPWALEPFIFPGLAITVVDDAGELTIDDAEPAEGGSACNDTTCFFGAGGYEWLYVLDGQVDVFQDVSPDGWSFEWAEVGSRSVGLPPPPQEVLADGVSFDFDTSVYTDGMFVRLYDFVATGGEPSAQPSTAPSAGPTVTPPPTASAAGPILTVDLAPILIVLAGTIGLLVVAVRRPPGVRR